MCGFAGFSGVLENLEYKEKIINAMTARILHRGPDMGGEYCDDDVALGFRRLSIIDLSEDGAQPMKNEDGSVIIVFNGEIYNFESLREKLLAAGHMFHSKTDTEVIIHGYEEYGTKIAQMLRGMFAFVIWDKNKKMLYGARDYFGIKPFYYGTLRTGELIFGSEIKSFLEHPDFEKKLNKKALRPYLTFQYSSMEETFFEGVKKLPPAHFFTWTREDGEVFAGEMVSAWKDLGEAYEAQTAYLTEKLAAAEADIAELDMALLDAEYENITGGTDDE